MRRMLLALVLGISGLLAAAMPAAAHTPNLLVWRPYVIEKTCNDKFRHCTARMKYAPGQHAGIAGPGSYWYQKANLRVHDDFRIRPHVKYRTGWHSHRKVRHHVHHTSRRVVVPAKYKHQHCRRTGWVYNNPADRFVTGVPKAWRCIPSYDGR